MFLVLIDYIYSENRFFAMISFIYRNISQMIGGMLADCPVFYGVSVQTCRSNIWG